MEISDFKGHGRRLLVEFTCQRCGVTATRTLENCVSEADEQSNISKLYNMRPPLDWRDGGFYYPLFCQACAEAHDRFMKGEK